MSGDAIYYTNSYSLTNRTVIVLCASGKHYYIATITYHNPHTEEVKLSPCKLCKRCCDLDGDFDGNCRVHSAPGVMRTATSDSTPFAVPDWLSSASWGSITGWLCSIELTPEQAVRVMSAFIKKESSFDTMFIPVSVISLLISRVRK